MQPALEPQSVSARPRVAVYFRSDGFDTSASQLMGRQAAGESFLRALLEWLGEDEFRAFVERPEEVREFAALLKRAAPGARFKRLRAYAPEHLHQLREAETLFIPGPALDHFAELRAHHGATAFSICGVTHTTASQRVMDRLGGLVTGPVMPWDALVCTSRVVKDTVERVLGDYEEHLRRTLGATHFSRPQLPIIPLGVETRLFAGSSDEPRQRWRARLGIGPDDVAVLYVGRLSFHAKAHPAVMYRALERAVNRLGAPFAGRVHLIQAGWFSNQGIESAFAQGAQEFCPNVRCHFIDAREPSARFEIWQAADVFTSLADNIQETFGLTPLEGMAAGLPVVVSDWNGYRDTVRADIDGFRVPTFMPEAGQGRDLAQQYQAGAISYDRYCGLASQLIAVDTEACADAYQALIANPDLRRRMGRAGQERAREQFDWRRVIQRYVELWRELGERRVAAQSVAASAWPGNPLRADPFQLFDSYPTGRLDDNTRLRRGSSGETLDELCEAVMSGFATSILPPRAVLCGILGALNDSQPVLLGDLLATLPETQRFGGRRAIYWLVKHGLVERVAGATRR